MYNSFKEEKEYILASNPKSLKKEDLPFPPLVSIFTNRPFLGITISHAIHNWGFFTLMTGIPQYLNSILHFSLAKVSMH